VSDEWRGVPIDKLDLSWSTCCRLKRSGLETLGDIERFIDDRRPFRELPDIGVTRQNQILEAAEGYWRRRRSEADRHIASIQAFYASPDP
jgi:hypothetical protein